MASQECDRAVQRLEAARIEQDRLGARFDAAVGTSTESGAYVRLRAAVDRVRAREAWVHWVGDESYRGLNAGPFEHLAERRADGDSRVARGRRCVKCGTPLSTYNGNRTCWAHTAEQRPAELRQVGRGISKGRRVA